MNIEKREALELSKAINVVMSHVNPNVFSRELDEAKNSVIEFQTSLDNMILNVADVNDYVDDCNEPAATMSIGAKNVTTKPFSAKIISSSCGETEDKVTLSFNKGTLNVQNEAMDEQIKVTHLEITKNALRIAENNAGYDWHEFHVTKLPKEITTLFDVGEIYEVI